ncbi:HDOD domain-containing protein [Hydrogenovibrio marinus]|uniref:HDOD domain-containing protein n=1 Tax=Hydrogenovibrio marinus TaxID=28885 RepID=A0A067A181_HYDMR|nr:HDOD domain-containing protein [Hydrogenovibrio marinus]KDN96376.1 hypothetical protein EI16_08875 [Hydrogenovibrio marinus]BBN60430.1 hypothetical protein HVMH_2024 [Hydrogenovibrio marinus]
MEQRLRQAVQAIKGIKIPDLPKEIMELDEEMSRKFPNNQTITRIIESNTKLSGEVLRIANSPVMKLRNPVKSIREAVDALGYENLKNLVISAALKIFSTILRFRELLSIQRMLLFAAPSCPSMLPK